MKTKIVGLLCLVWVAGSLLSGCTIAGGLANLEMINGSGEVITETREVSGFSSVVLQGTGDVNIDVTGSESLSITADSNFLPYLETVVRGDTLFIRTTEEVVFSDITQLDFNITAASLESFELQGAGEVNIQNLDTDNWSVKLPGAGRIAVSGRTTEQRVELQGAANYDAPDLASEVATITSSGAGSAVVRVSDELDVTINGLGNVEYIGDPVVTEEINGVGNVTKRQ